MQFSLEYGILNMYTNKYELMNERIAGLQQRIKKANADAAKKIGGECFYCAGTVFGKTVDITAYGQVHDKNFFRERI